MTCLEMADGDLVCLPTKWVRYVQRQKLYASYDWDTLLGVYRTLTNVQIVAWVDGGYFINTEEQQKELERLRGSEPIIYYLVPKPNIKDD